MSVRDTPRRRRRSPDEARREIIEAAEALLNERPFRELTVDELMRRTGLSRPSFYVYFRDRHHLVLCVVKHIQDEFTKVADVLRDQRGDGTEGIHVALRGLVDVYVRHGPVLCALADAAADDPGVEEVYHAMIRSRVDAAARHIEVQIADGLVSGIDPWTTAEALVLMNERYLGRQLGRPPFADPEEVVRTVTGIWARTLYGC